MYNFQKDRKEENKYCTILNLLDFLSYCLILKIILFRGLSWHRGTKCDSKIDWSWVRSPRSHRENELFIVHLHYHFLALVSQRRVLSLNTQCPELGGKWVTNYY